jgi:hypothetical protein
VIKIILISIEMITIINIFNKKLLIK